MAHAVRENELGVEKGASSTVDVETRVRIDRARQAQADWGESGLARRLAMVRRLRHRIARHGMALAEAALRGGGQLAAEKLVSEVVPLADACRFLEREGPSILRPRRL